jgi:ribonuclease HII
MPCSLDHETRLRALGFSLIAGVDESGRGPLAGPVVAAAVILPVEFRCDGLDDSKKMSPAAREWCYGELMREPGVVWSMAVIGPEEIDRLNILKATHKAMRRAVAALAAAPAHVLIDGLPVRRFPFPQTALIGGDGISLSIAAASVVAKVTRDRLMEDWAQQYPQYGFERHKGYATPEHFATLREHGPCPIHRRSFGPMAEGEVVFD